MEAQHDSAHISNKAGTMWLWTINIQQCHGHSGGICLLGPPSPSPPPPLSLLCRLSHAPHLFSSPTPLLSSLWSFLFIPLRWAVQSCSTTHSLLKGRWTAANSHMLLWLFPSLKSKWAEIAEYVLTSSKIRAPGDLDSRIKHSKCVFRGNMAKMPLLVTINVPDLLHFCFPICKIAHLFRACHHYYCSCLLLSLPSHFYNGL